MSFRNLTSGERRRLKAGILSGPEAAAVSARAGSKPSGWSALLGGIRVAATTVAAVYTGGASTPFIQAIEKEVGGPTPAEQLGLVSRARAQLPGGTMSRRADFVDVGGASDGGFGWSDLLGTATQVLTAYSGGRRAIAPIAMSVTEAEAGGPRAIGGAVAGGAALAVRSILLRIKARLGYGLSLRGVIDLVRRFGPGVVLTFLGIGIEDLMLLWFHHERRHRRRARGISGRDITRAQRTIRRMSSFMCRVQEVCSMPAVGGRSYARARSRRPGCRGCGRRPCTCR